MKKLNNNYKINQDSKYEGDDWWSWWIWIEADEMQMKEIDFVVYTLHPTFYNPVRKIIDKKSKFLLKAEGWGTFPIHAKVVFLNKEEILLKHELHLEYPDGKSNIE